MVRKTFAQEMPNKNDRVIIFHSDTGNKVNCLRCIENKGHFLRPLKLPKEVVVDCAKCGEPNIFSLKHKWEKVSKKEEKL